MIKRDMKSLPANQQGLVAIFSVLIIMGILTLLTIGFSGITQEAQKRALDDFLNTQAFYAAETGINSAITRLRNGTITTQNNNCDPITGISYIVEPTRNIGISCLLVDPTPPEAIFDAIPEAGVDEPVVSAVRSVDGSNITSLEIEWDSADPNDGLVPYNFVNNSPVLPNDATWGNRVGMLRIDVVPQSIAPGQRGQLVSQGYTFYLYPTENASAPPSNGVIPPTMPVLPGVNAQAGTLITRCNATGDYRCKGRVDISAPSNGYYIRLQSYYNPVRASVAGLDAGNQAVELRDGQAVIDSTGRANDVFRRIQVRVPMSTTASWRNGLHEAFAIFSGDALCKRLIAAPPHSSGAGGTVVARPPGVVDPSCGLVP